MKIAACSIQRNRGPWLVEWVAFHHLVGVTDFVIYLHACGDDSAEILTRLGALFRITSYVVTDVAFAVQLSCFQHAVDNHSGDFDWTAFIDGDEFLFPSAGGDLARTLARFEAASLSAVAVYWRCFGSSGHVAEPKGLLTHNYRRCSAEHFVENRHVKSIVRRGSGQRTLSNSHVFATTHGTRDENLRPIAAGFDPAHVPSWRHLRINHYATQSRAFYDEVKRASGAADAGPGVIRPEAWWEKLDRNEIDDHSLDHLLEPLASLVDGICAATGISRDSLGGLSRPARPASA